MAKDFWINLPVKNVHISKAFFSAIGFTFHATQADPNTSVCFIFGEKGIVLMLFSEPVFENFTKNKIPNAQLENEVLLSIGAESKPKVDELFQKVKDNGGTIISAPGDNQGYMYGGVFADPDGHRWNVLFMDMGKMPK